MVFLLLLKAVFLFSAMADEMVLEPERPLENRIRPFTTDGCSRFPDGVPFVNETQWQSCCLEHDLAYWQGGTAHDRRVADENLMQCVESSSGPLLARLMFLGVRLGGAVGLPTTWHWGYGWVTRRGYEPLSQNEIKVVRSELDRVTIDFDGIELISQTIIPRRHSLTGDYCRDIAIGSISLELGRSFFIKEQTQMISTGAEGWHKKISITPDGCTQPFEIDFHLLRPDACESPMNELLARGRIRIKKVSVPEGCR